MITWTRNIFNPNKMSLLHIWHHSLHVGCIVENDLVIIGAHKWENDGYLFVLVS